MIDVDISALFNQYFEIVYAHDETLKEKCYKIRYDVYCDELGFEDPSSFRQPREIDECDEYSHHYLIRHRSTGLFAGTVRVVDPSFAGTSSAYCPIQKFCSFAITDKNYHPDNLAPFTYCEVSRLAVPSAFRRRTGEQGQAFVYEGERVSLTDTEKKTFPYIAVGLYLTAAAHFILEKNLDHILVMMEPRLALHLRRVGINFKQIGETIEYHGQRAPFHIDPERLLGGMNPAFRALYDSIEASVIRQLTDTRVPIELLKAV